MPPKFPSPIKTQESLTERQEQLKRELGVVICTKNKDGKSIPLKNQIEIAENMTIPTVQFDFRNQTPEQILSAKEALVTFRENHPDIVISIHGETPRINPSDLAISNTERTNAELLLLQEVKGESYTVHPPSVSSGLFDSLPEATRATILKNYTDTLTQTILNAFQNKKEFSFGIENMPTKGAEGSWGQTHEDILLLIHAIEKNLSDYGVPEEEIKKYVGATLDVNHALHSAEKEEYQKILESWFQNLGEYLKIVHLYLPSDITAEFTQKYETAVRLASEHNPNARIFIESKQDPKITKDLYQKTRAL